MTHDDFASNASCAAFAAVLWDALRAAPPVGPGFWLGRFLAVARAIEGTGARYVPRAPHLGGVATTLAGIVEARVPLALAAGLPSAAACDGWYSGAFLLETVPSMLYLLERHGADDDRRLHALAPAARRRWCDDG